AEEMVRGWRKLGSTRRLDGAHVAEERVEPDVGHEAIVEGQVDAPVEPALRPRDAEVADRLAQQREHFATVAVRRDALGLRLVQRGPALLVLLHAKEGVLLGCLRGGRT